MNIWQRWRQSTVTNQAMVVLTGLIAFLTAINIFVYVMQSRDQSQQVKDIESAITEGITAAKEAINSSLTENRQGMEHVFTENRQALQASLDTIHENAQAALQTSIEQGQGALDATIAASQLDQRPWLKVDHRILEPLRFDVGGRSSGRDVAMLVLENVVENVGKSVATNVFVWEDVIPADLDFSPRSALARQKEHCDENRFPQRHGLSGYMLFPGQTMVTTSQMGPTMDRVKESTHSDGGLAGQAAFVVVGCIHYTSSFESETTPTHQTRFAYYLGVQVEEGGVNPYVVPEGVASQLKLIRFPLGFSAD